MRTKNQIETRLNALETAPRRQRTAETMTDTELCNIIGLGKNPTDEQLMGIIEGKV